MLKRRLAKQLLLIQDVRVREVGAGARNLRIAFVDFEETEQIGRVHNRQQVVDFKGKIVRQPIDVVLAMVIDQDLQQPGNAARSRMRKHLVVRRLLLG